MAKITKFRDGGCFYDAFGGKVGTVEESWAGDSFDRSAVSAAYVPMSGELSFTADNCYINTDAWNTIANANTCDSRTLAFGSASHAEGLGSIAKGDVTLTCKDVVFSSDIETLQDQLSTIRARLDVLEQSMVTTNKLRNELKTLQYKREVE